MQEFNSTGEFVAAISFRRFCKAAVLDQLRKRFDIVGQKHGIVDELFVALVAEDRFLAFDSPRAFVEDRRSLASLFVR